MIWHQALAGVAAAFGTNPQCCQQAAVTTEQNPLSPKQVINPVVDRTLGEVGMNGVQGSGQSWLIRGSGW